jgi:hypothetical protein
VGSRSPEIERQPTVPWVRPLAAREITVSLTAFCVSFRFRPESIGQGPHAEGLRQQRNRQPWLNCLHDCTTVAEASPARDQVITLLGGETAAHLRWSDEHSCAGFLLII